jgi:hypothetical protein
MLSGGVVGLSGELWRGLRLLESLILWKVAPVLSSAQAFPTLPPPDCGEVLINSYHALLRLRLVRISECSKSVAFTIGKAKPSGSPGVYGRLEIVHRSPLCTQEGVQVFKFKRLKVNDAMMKTSRGIAKSQACHVVCLDQQDSSLVTVLASLGSG